MEVRDACSSSAQAPARRQSALTRSPIALCAAACRFLTLSPAALAARRQRKHATMTTMAPVAFDIDIKSPAPVAKTPVQKRLEQLSPKKSPSSPAIEEKLAKAEEAHKVCV